MMVGVVLGAGASTRLGRPKQSLPLGDTTVLGWVVRCAERSSLERVVVVAEAVGRAAVGGTAGGRLELVEPGAAGEGCATSLHAGLRMAGECDAVMVLLGDMPGLDAAMIDAVRAAWERERPWGLVTRYDDEVGHPFVFAAEAIPALKELHGDKAIWKLVDQHRDRVVEAPIHGRRPLDIDTPEDYQAVLASISLRGAAPA
jgi:molybdenum cofactor cytidylyltransferase